jgi:hypothetical protein
MPEAVPQSPIGEHSVKYMCSLCENRSQFLVIAEIHNVTSYITNSRRKKEYTMIQSIQAGNTALYTPTRNVTGAGKVTTSEAQTSSAAAQNEDETTTTSSQGDTLTISNAGAQAQQAQKTVKTFTAESANRPSVAGTSEDTYTDSKAEAISSAASSAGITEYTAVKNENSANAAAVSGSSSSSSSSSDSNLSEYTDSELKKMLQNGEITQAEYDAEIKSREESSSDSDDDSETTAVSDTNETEA